MVEGCKTCYCEVEEEEEGEDGLAVELSLLLCFRGGGKWWWVRCFGGGCEEEGCDSGCGEDVEEG